VTLLRAFVVYAEEMEGEALRYLAVKSVHV
jgi:hypothetical protein